jgi:squalene-hopene/tetraprenyl-beta-curcumene cyclase
MTLTPARPVPRDDLAAAAAAERAVGHLRGLQSAAGWWKGELQTNVTMDAEDLLLREFLGIRTAEETAQAARWIRSQQRDDGSWATFEGGPGDVSTTTEAWVALRLAGDRPNAAHMARAAEFVRGGGGVAATRVFTRIWLALFGLQAWADLPALPPEMVLLPRWAPLNPYDFACWARQTIVPLTVVAARRPVRPLPFGIGELSVPGRSPASKGSRFWRLFDRTLHRYERHPVGPLRRLAVRRAVRWVLDRQEADGSWGGIQPPWVYSLLALVLTGHALDSPPVARGLAGLDGFLVRERTPEGAVRRLEACQSPVWDTALAVIALRDAGVPPADETLTRAADWLLGEEIDVRGDWAVRRPRLAPGGWAFEFANDGYPDVDDTAEVVLALRRVAVGDPAARDAAVGRGLAWVLGMRSRDGGWAAFDADNTSPLPARLPFCDFGAVTDPPSADVTAHVVEALAAAGLAGSPEARGGVRWLRAAQEPDGSWFGRWGANHVYGTGAVVPALTAAGVPADDPAVRRAVAWLERVQQEDGGWGEDLRSYRDPAWIGRGTPTASQTAWALLALLAAGRRDSAAVRRGVRWLVARQRADGTWDEPQFTGTGFPGDFFINYHLYRLVFPLSALGRYAAAEPAGTAGTGGGR